MSSVRYGTRLGDLKNKQPTESTELGSVTLKNKQSTESLMSAGIGCTEMFEHVRGAERLPVPRTVVKMM